MTDHTEMQIPDGVMEAAIAAEKNMKFNGQTFVIAAIARAILQERERCARIADARIDLYDKDQAKNACREIASSIRGPVDK